MKIKKHIPNILSSSRLISPLVLIPSIMSGNYLLAFSLLSAFLLTDALDGHLARKWHVESSLGAKIDAVADKLILGSLLIPLAITNPLVIINLVLEGLISVVNLVRKSKGGNPKTHQLGRIKMVVISLFTALSYLGKIVSIPSLVINTFSIITSILQVGTLTKYIEDGQKELKEIKSKSNDSLEEIEKINNQGLSNEKVLENNDLIENTNNQELSKLETKKEELEKLRSEIINLSNCEDVKLSEGDKQKIKKLF